MKLKKGYTYLAPCGNRWYMIQQVSQRGWIATQFTHAVGVPDEFKHYSGNSLSLVKQLEDAEFDFESMRRYCINSLMRKAMFNILKEGRIES